LADDVGQTFYLYLLEKNWLSFAHYFMYNGIGPIPRIAPSISNSRQRDYTKRGGRSLLAAVNCAIFIPRKQEDKGKFSLAFLSHVFYM
jgi:hypothetical protein